MPHSVEEEKTAPEIITHPVPSRLLDPKQCPTPHVNSMEQYRAMWKESVEQPDQFFGNVTTLYIQPSTHFILTYLVACSRIIKLG